MAARRMRATLVACALAFRWSTDQRKTLYLPSSPTAAFDYISLNQP